MDDIATVSQTWAEERPDGATVFFAFCTCGWRGNDHHDELPADMDRLVHDASMHRPD